MKSPKYPSASIKYISKSSLCFKISNPNKNLNLLSIHFLPPLPPSTHIASASPLPPSTTSRIQTLALSFVLSQTPVAAPSIQCKTTGATPSTQYSTHSIFVAYLQIRLTMDLETENRLAAMLVEEARRLQAQADKEGVLAYLHRPNVRGRPNSRFLTATVLGVEQANRVVEVNEMWRAREKEKELAAKPKRKMKDRELNYDDKYISNSNKTVYSSRHEQHYRNSNNPSSSKRSHDHAEEDDGLRDDELEEFLRSRAKRGRGDIGPRMDEPGPYPSAPLKSDDYETREKEDWERRIVGPQKSPCIKSYDSQHEYIQTSDSSKKKQHTKEKKRKRSKDESSDKKKRKEERKKKKSKHRCHKKHGSRSDSE